MITSASVPDAVIFKDDKFLYFVNGDFDGHSIHVSSLSGDNKVAANKTPIKLDGEIVGDAVDPDLLVTEDGRLRLYYYVGISPDPLLARNQLTSTQQFQMTALTLKLRVLSQQLKEERIRP